MQIKTTPTAVLVTAPYNPAFIADAKRIGGRWSAPAWMFDIRDEDRVRELCMEHYGEDGRAPTETKTVRVTFAQGLRGEQDAARFCGREIARARGRDTGARLGKGVVILDGKIGSGGSVKNWLTVVSEGTTVLIRDVPAPMVERMLAEAADSRGDITAAIEDEVAPIDRSALMQERERLYARIAEIDALIAEGAE